MSRLSDLLRQLEAKDRQLADDLRREYQQLQQRRAFGLNFERHVPESVELPGRPVRKGDKVRFLVARGEPVNSVDRRLWQVLAVHNRKGQRVAELARRESPDAELQQTTRAVADLVVVAEFRDPIYPGLRSSGKIERGGDKPFHAVINAENYHALQALLYTHEGKIDAIYIDPPYNTGAKDWKYNNDYVDGEDAYRHSKWLAMMERRLKLAKRLLNPENSVLIVTIDEKEYLRLGLLLEQLFPDAGIQMVTSVINPMGSRRSGEFSRVDEYIFFIMNGSAAVPDANRNMLDRESPTAGRPVRWTPLNRDGSGWERKARPNMFFPLFVDLATRRIVEVGNPIPLESDRGSVPTKDGCVTIWPMKGADEARWQVGAETARDLLSKGFITVGALDPTRKTGTIRYLTSGAQNKIANGIYIQVGRRDDGSHIVETTDQRSERPRSVWNQPSHSARDHGTSMLAKFLPDHRFPFPKSLYAVEDALRFFVADKPDAVILDFFSGSGTTAHAVMRLNKQDGGRRQCISVTNNEVSADEQKTLREKGLRPGDPEWEALGICDYVTKPRIRAAITGKTPDGEPIKGDYKFTDEFPMADGFEENVEFFTLTYEAPRPVAHHRSFAAIAPLLWLRAGAQGRRIDQPVDDFDIAEAYGVLFDLDAAEGFLASLHAAPSVRLAFIVTDDDRGFAAVCRDLPAEVEAVRLYASYLTNFTINTGRD
ncbi:MAG: hypothetical protein Tsb0027_23450 [Wenzhouxiangellaceae bacterium]